MQELFTRQEAAAKLRIATKTLDKHVAAGVLRYVSIGPAASTSAACSPPPISRILSKPKAKGFPAVSVRKPKNSPFYYYEFEFRGHRFHRSTKARQPAGKRKP